MNWQVVWTRSALKDRRRLDASIERRVVETVDRFAATGHGDVKRLSGRDHEWRLRVGDWRVIFTLEPATRRLLVLRVRNRSHAYDE